MSRPRISHKLGRERLALDDLLSSRFNASSECKVLYSAFILSKASRINPEEERTFRADERNGFLHLLDIPIP